ncbi:hypothetical protein ES703_01519 [subsurface metagenome]
MAANGDQDSVILPEEAINCQALANRCVGFNLYTQSRNIIDVGLDRSLGKSELGNCSGQHTASHWSGFINGNTVSCFHQVVGGSEAGRPRTYNGYLFLLRPLGRGRFPLGLQRIISRQPFDPLNCDRFIDNDSTALELAGMVANPPGNGRKGVGVPYYFHSFLELALRHGVDITRNIHTYGTSLAAGRYPVYRGRIYNTYYFSVNDLRS